MDLLPSAARGHQTLWCETGLSSFNSELLIRKKETRRWGRVDACLSFAVEQVGTRQLCLTGA